MSVKRELRTPIINRPHETSPMDSGPLHIPGAPWGFTSTRPHEGNLPYWGRLFGQVTASKQALEMWRQSKYIPKSERGGVWYANPTRPPLFY